MPYVRAASEEEIARGLRAAKTADPFESRGMGCSERIITAGLDIHILGYSVKTVDVGQANRAANDLNKSVEAAQEQFHIAAVSPIRSF